MPSYVYIDESDWAETELTPADIDACTDADQLKEWWRGLDEVQDNIKAQLEARRLTGTDDAEWVWRASQAMAYTGMGMGRIRRKLKAHGFDPNPYGSKLEQLQRKLQTLKVEAAFGRAFVAAAQAALPAAQFTALNSQAVASLEAAVAEKEAA